jgi:choline dehydrogenase-like flavoprotein
MRDVVVVGCGGGGPVIAKELARWGLDVLVLESGPRHAEPEREWSRLENDANNPITGYLRAGPGDRSAAAWSRELPGDELIWQVSGVGGTTLHYFGNCPRAMPGAFAGYDGPDAGRYDTAHAFPFSFADLRPYYRWVEATLPVHTAPMGTKEERFLRGAEAMGLPVCRTKEPTGPSFRPQENAILPPGGTAGRVRNPGFPQATGCVLCGHCAQGCVLPAGAPRNLRAKRSTDNSYVPMMLTADAWADGGRPAELITDAHVIRVHTTGRGSSLRATGVTFLDPRGGAQRVDARVVVLAAGVVETPRLWFNSGLPNPNGWVGRGLTDHHVDMVIGSFDEYTGSSKGAGSNARVDYPGRGGLENVCLSPALLAFTFAYSDSGTWGVSRGKSRATSAGADSVGRLVGPDLVDRMSDVDRVLTALVLTDDDVEPGNRVQPAQVLPPDRNGHVPRVVLRHRQRSARTFRNREFLAARAVELMRAAGAKHVHRADWPPLMVHIHSTMRMGSKPSTSVLDQWAESRFVQRLFVADNSALANALGGPNPTLTTQAVATRTAERVLRRYFDGDPWVGRQDPVSSIDDRVTAAVIERGL